MPRASIAGFHQAHGALEQFSEPAGAGAAFVELSCTFAGRSIVPDVVFLREEHIAYDEEGVFVNEILLPPDIHIEIISPNQSLRDATRS